MTDSNSNADVASTAPLVFGHRGSCGYRPENTLEAFELAFAQGVVAIECDLVPSKDGQLIIRHESSLSLTTDVASRGEFADRLRERSFRFGVRTDWFTDDFTLDELRTLKAKERLPIQRPGSAKFDGLFNLASLTDLLESPLADGKWLILEVKHAAHFAQLGLDPVPMLAAALKASDWASRGIRLTLETFDFDVLQKMKEACGPVAKYVFLTEPARLPAGQANLSEEFLAQLAENFDGIGVELGLLLEPADEANPMAQFGAPTDLVSRAHALGLTVYGWTARVEDAKYSVEEYYSAIIETGVDGIFADQPDLLRAVVTGRS